MESPPQALFDQYLKEMFKDEVVTSVDFRNKIYGWDATRIQ